MTQLDPAWLATITRQVPGFTLVSTPEPLTGGNLNHVWRLRGDHGTLILKQAPPHVAARPGIPLSPERLAFEARALGLFREEGRFTELAEGPVRPPRLFHYDSSQHFLVMEDVGPGPDLAAAVEGDCVPGPAAEELGQFLARVHVTSRGSTTLARVCDNRVVQETRFQVQYRGAEAMAREAGLTALDAMKDNALALGRRLLEPGRCLIMGDLWPPSVLFNGSAVRVIDWEFAHYGRPLQDLAHLGAHCWMQAQTAATPGETGRWLAFWASLANGYKQIAGSALPELLPPAEEQQMNVHAGAEILMRCAGPFVSGYLYEGLPPGDRLRQEALQEAGRLLAQPPPRFFLGF